MSYYFTCPECGANLDPGEVCECENWSDQRKELVKVIHEMPDDALKVFIEMLEQGLKRKESAING